MNPSVESSLGAGSAVTAIAADGVFFQLTAGVTLSAGFTRSYMLPPLSRLMTDGWPLRWPVVAEMSDWP